MCIRWCVNLIIYNIFLIIFYRKTLFYAIFNFAHFCRISTQNKTTCVAVAGIFALRGKVTKAILIYLKREVGLIAYYFEYNFLPFATNWHLLSAK
jgi:hypothetical protein